MRAVLDKMGATFSDFAFDTVAGDTTPDSARGTTAQLKDGPVPIREDATAALKFSGDNSVVCTDFTVAAGETKTFTINNQPPPGGMSLTIGYWKNWSS